MITEEARSESKLEATSQNNQWEKGLEAISVSKKIICACTVHCTVCSVQCAVCTVHAAAEAINESKEWKQSVVGVEWIVGASREKSENQ